MGYFHSFKDGVDYVFVDHSCYHSRGKDIYGGDRQDIMFRCALLCKAALEAVWHVPCGGIVYGDQNLCFIANDWHTALLPVYLQVRAPAGLQRPITLIICPVFSVFTGAESSMWQPDSWVCCECGDWQAGMWLVCGPLQMLLLALLYAPTLQRCTPHVSDCSLRPTRPGCRPTTATTTR